MAPPLGAFPSQLQVSVRQVAQGKAKKGTDDRSIFGFCILMLMVVVLIAVITMPIVGSLFFSLKDHLASMEPADCNIIGDGCSSSEMDAGKTTRYLVTCDVEISYEGATWEATAYHHGSKYANLGYGSKSKANAYAESLGEVGDSVSCWYTAEKDCPANLKCRSISLATTQPDSALRSSWYVMVYLFPILVGLALCCAICCYFVDPHDEEATDKAERKKEEGAAAHRLHDLAASFGQGAGASAGVGVPAVTASLGQGGQGADPAAGEKSTAAARLHAFAA
mmetsp:Transcript_12028/g.21426  ORF Transcript_12028/g.21426 Transcript_12028/m.21426 type:complete len:280 (-) Transcript_12028:618-1457(-)